MTEVSSEKDIKHCVVWVEHFPESLHGPQWTFGFRATSLLEYCAHTLNMMVPGKVVLAAPETTSRRIKEVLQSCGLPIFWSGFERTLLGLHQVGSELGARRILAVHGLAGVGLLPPDFLLRFLGEAEKFSEHLVVAADLPYPLYAHVYDRDALGFFSELAKQPLMADNPGLVIGKFDEILAGLPAEQRELRLHYVSVLKSYGISSCLGFIPWAQKSDIARIEAVLSREPVGSPGVKLEELRRRIIDETEPVYRKRFRQSCGSMPVRVLFASDPSAYSGGEECLINSIRSLGSRIDAHALVALEGLFTERLRSAGVTVHCPGHDFAKPTVKNSLVVDDLLEQVKPDLVHCNGVVGSPLLSALILRGIRSLHWVRTAEVPPYDEHFCCADRITVVSNFIAAIVSKQIVPTEKIRVLYDCVDCDRFSPAAAPLRNVRGQYGIRDEEQIILCVARYAPNKRHDVLIDAFAMLAAELPNTRLVLVGETSAANPGAYERCLQKISERGVAHNVLLLGFQPDVLSLERTADVVVLCSEREPLGTVVLESMALGRPVIVSASGGLPEMIDDGITGLHCIPGDSVSLFEQMGKILRNPDLAAFLGERARRAAVQRFGLPAHGNALMAIYEELIAKAAAA